ncbi:MULTISPECIES: uracil-xanthine permease family protein [Rhodococcus]|uniref:Purine permease n=1 Tax=Rhodococcus erythropolis TaxID=1833 RepID=A0A8I1D961_RHOER|nr:MULTISPECIES: nucleobase:cation symporter-2 family protein [Rhodococcus]MBH5144303.1 purine permease [Rhodococcus erythropolis]MBX9152170.1 purine permease [Rhodococcus qingshengii]MDJ0434759.1 nucleobase:cation symporter-2 family protein [Rhodococcus qingshengii]QEM25762.1 purine permease [Rhodococcus qingshengii]
MPVHPVDTRPPIPRLVAFGLQHVLIMYTGCVSVPLIFGAAVGLDAQTIAMLICADLLISGVITVVQSLGIGRAIGIRLPIICGGSFSALAPMILIAHQYGMPAVYGSMLVGGLIGIPLAWLFSGFLRFFPPLVTGAVLTVVGLSLIGVAGGLIVGQDSTATDFASPTNIGFAALIILIAVAVLCLGRGLWRQLGVLIALVIGVVISIPMGLYDLSAVGTADWFGIPTPFHFGAPEFPVTAVVAMSIVMIVVFAESTASILALGEITGKPISRGDLARGLTADSVSGIVGAVFNAFIDTVYANNVGAVSTTRVYSRYVTAVSGVILIMLGLVPKLGALVAGLPAPVVGGVGLILFAVVAIVGINTLREVDLGDPINMTIAAATVGVGLLPTFMPGMFTKFPDSVQIVLGSGITLAAVTAFVFNLVLNHTGLGTSARRALAASDRDTNTTSVNPPIGESHVTY